MMRQALRIVATTALAASLGCGIVPTGPTKPTPATVTVTLPASAILVGDTIQANVDARDAAGNPVEGAATWSSSNPAVASVSQTGRLAGVAVGGPVTITATVRGKTGSAGVTVASDDRFAYAWADQESAAGPYAPNAGVRYNSSGGGIQITRSATGTYSVRFAGLGRIPGQRDNVQVTGFGTGPGYCKTGGWQSTAADLVVDVRCFSRNGQPVDHKYTVLVTGGRALQGRVGFMLSNEPPGPGALEPATFYSSGNLAGVNIVRDAPGVFEAFLGVPRVTGSGPETVQVTAVGTGPERCMVLGWDQVAGMARRRRPLGPGPARPARCRSPEPFNAHHADRTVLDRVLRTIASTGDATAPRVLPVRLAILRGRAESVRLGSPDGDRKPGVLDPWNGNLRDPRVLEKLAEKFGPERRWSASQLESYSQNPFVFLIQRVLWLDEVLEADEDVNPMAWGGVAHRVLERFHRVGAGFIPPLREFTGDAAALFDRVFDEVQAELDAEDTWLGLPAVWRARRRGMRRQLEEFLAWELPKLKGWTPDRFELGFGFEGDAPFTITGDDLRRRAVTLRLRGRIDRVDADGKGGSRVVDYKSGTIPEKKGYADGGTLQAPLYLAALGSLGFRPVKAVYLSVKQTRAGAEIEWGTPECEGALRMAFSIPERVRSGWFEPSAAESCKKWKDWWPGGLALFRCAAVLEGCRFHE